LAHPLLIVDALIGIGLLAVIAVAARHAPASTSTVRKLVGWGLVAGPLPVAVALHLSLALPVVVDQAAFIVGVIAFAIGAFLVLSADDGKDRPEPMDELEPPPWWPDFERDFRAYARSRRRTHV
jgi:hypothetical protein